MIGSSCTWRYRKILLLLQRPMRLMMLVSTPEQRSAMAPATRRDRAETSLGVKPRWVPAGNLAVALRWVVIIVWITYVQRPLGVLKLAREVSAGAPCCHRWDTRHCNASFGENMGSPVAPCPIFSSRTPCFYVVKTSITNMAAASSLSVAVVVSNTIRTTLSVKSDRRKGTLSYFVPVYYPGRRRKKKKEIIIISVTACISGSL